jgi:hypothetical protein
MTREQLLQRISGMLDDAAKAGTFGTIEVEIREGAPVLIRTIKTEKIPCTGNGPHATNKTRY